MKKNKRNSKEKIKPTVNFNRVLEQFTNNFKDIIAFLPSDEINLLIRQAIDEMPSDLDSNPDFYVSFLAERKLFIKLKDEILAGNIELEILLVERYLSTAKFQLRQLKYLEDDSNKVAEDAIIYCIENYSGESGFKSAILKSLKKIIRDKKDKIKGQSTVESNATSTSEDVDLPATDLNQLSSSLEASNKTVTELALPADDIVRMPNQLELLIRTVDILHLVPIDDELYLKFISLKYGYYENQYYNLDEISQILNISLEQSIKYYQDSLNYLKNWFGLQLEKTYTYYIQKSE